MSLLIPLPAAGCHPRLPGLSAEGSAAPITPSPDLVSTYGTASGELLTHYHRYPAAARSNHDEGLVVIPVIVGRDGHIILTTIDRKAGFPVLDHEALETFRRTDPLPPIPDGMPG